MRACRRTRRATQFHPPTFQVEAINTATDAGVALDARAAASRYVLGLVFVILLLISIIIYGMWVATGVAAEKSSRVMELMISAASAPQMLTGKVVGIGAAGLTQYIAIAIPAFVLLALQNQIATAVLGPDWVTGAPLGGMSVPLLLGYGVFFLLGFVLFALIYASMGSFVSRPDDLQTLSLPLSLVAMAGYLVAVVALGGASGGFVVLASFVPPFSPFVMLARLMVSAVAAVGDRAVGRVARGGHRGDRGLRDADVCGGRAAVRAAAGVAGVRGGGAAGLTASAELARDATPILSAATFVAGSARSRLDQFGRRTRASFVSGRIRQSSSSGNRLIRPGRGGGRVGASSSTRHRPRRRTRPRRHEPPQPAANPRQVRARALPGQDPGDPLRHGRLEQRDPFGRDGRHRHHLIARPQHPPQSLAPADQRLRQQRAAVEMEQVEGEERDRPPRLARQPPPELEVIRPPGRIDHDQLAIEDRRPRRDPHRQPGQLRQRRADIAPRGVAHDHVAAARPGRSARSRPARARRPTTARTGARPNRTAPAAGAGASAAGPGDRAARRPRG